MDRNGYLTLIFFAFIISDCSGAYSILGSRNLLSGSPKDNSSAKNISPSPSSLKHGNNSKASPMVITKSTEKVPNDPQHSETSTDLSAKGSKKDVDDMASVPPRPPNVIDNGKGHGGQEITEDKTVLQMPTPSNLSCKESIGNCSLNKEVIACIHGLDSGYKCLVLLVQNEGESNLELDVNVSTSLQNVTEIYRITRQITNRINITWTTGESGKLFLKAGNMTCTLSMEPPLSGGNLSLSGGGFLQQLPSYYKQVTPIYVAYFFFLIALVVGGTYACCQFRKRRRRQDGVPYQELEMGSSLAVNLETAEGWDAGWDDDWDEEMAVKSPGGGHTGNISANGLTARSSNRDGWENDWDD
ncbi:hypothetical protein NMG60_11000060 [Bertholletia excelsa]